MKCACCESSIPEGEGREHLGRMLCEDCYMDALSPAKTCDPWAVHCAKSFDELRPEFRREDLGKGVRGKYFEDYRKGTNLVLLSPDVAKVFSTEEAVNQALRSLISLAEKSMGRTGLSSGSTKKRASR